MYDISRGIYAKMKEKNRIVSINLFTFLFY